MRKRILLIASITIIGALGLVGCGKKSPSSPEATTEATTEEVTEDTTTTEAETSTEEKNTASEEVTTTEKEQAVATEEETEATEKATKITTATKADENAKDKTAKGSFGGWVDSESVEIEMSNGQPKTFFVKKSAVKKILNKTDEGAKITFTYGAIQGQANMEITSIK